jgi:hypothetical protein
MERAAVCEFRNKRQRIGGRGHSQKKSARGPIGSATKSETASPLEG